MRSPLHRFPRRSCRSIAAAVIDENDFVIDLSLDTVEDAADALQQRCDVFRFVVERNDDAEKRKRRVRHLRWEVFNLKREEPATLMAVIRASSSIAVALSLLVACTHGTASRRQPGATKAPSSLPSAARPPLTTPVRSAVPTFSPSPAPVVTPNRLGAPLPPPPKKVTRLAPQAQPQILGVAMSETTVQPGDRVFGRVVTSSNVASVEARIGGYAVSLVKTGVGRFELAYTVAALPDRKSVV